MKKILVLVMFAIVLTGFVLALENNINPLGNSDDSKNNIVCTEEAKLCSDGSYVSRNSNNDCRFNACPEENLNDTERPVLGASCGTVTPGYQNECCVNKGYSGWNQTAFKCIGEVQKDGNIKGVGEMRVGAINANRKINESEDNRFVCEAWNCTKWSACLNETKTRKCTKVVFNCTEDNKIPKLIKNCSEKEELKFYNKSRDYPEECICSGSTIKCTFENGTRVMTIYAGKSGNVIVQIKNLNMSTNVTLYKNDEGKVYGVFKGNRTHEVKLPDEIKERLENHTRTKLYNESIDLNEEGQYYMNATKRARLFWMFPVKEKVEFSIDSETGDVTKTKTMWWGFLAKDIKEKTNNNLTEAQ
jgi:hypothetical protein